MPDEEPDRRHHDEEAAEERRSERDFAAEAVMQGLVTQAQIAEALKKQRAGAGPGPGRSLSEIMVEMGLITERQAERLRRALEPAGQAKIVGGFELIEKLGEGAMGVVYKARQVSLDRTVALKILPERLARDRNFIARFQREAKVAAKLDHVNVVRALDVGEAGGVRYFAMEFVEGRDVGSILEEKGSMSEREALRVTIQIARALEHAWKHSLIHRDVKPDNILVTTAGVAKLADLGLARSTEADGTRVTVAGVAVGTPHYISPEQARGEAEIDVRTDIYSLGVSLYHMLTGRPPFGGPSAAVTITRRLTEDPPWLRDAAPHVSEGTALVVRKMMARERDDRYAGPAELIADLELVAGGRMPAAAGSVEETVLWSRRSLEKPEEPPGLVEEDARRPTGRRGRSYALTGAAAFGLLVAAAAVAVWLLLSKPPPTGDEADEVTSEIFALLRQGDFPRALGEAAAAEERFARTPYARRFATLKAGLMAGELPPAFEAEVEAALAETASMRREGLIDEALQRAAEAGRRYSGLPRAEEFRRLHEELKELKLAGPKLEAALKTVADFEGAGLFDEALAKAREARGELGDTHLAARLDEPIARLERKVKERQARDDAEAELRALRKLVEDEAFEAAVARGEKAVERYAGTRYAAGVDRLVAGAKKALDRARAVSERFEAELSAAEEALKGDHYADAVGAYERALAVRDSEAVRRALRNARHRMHLALSRKAEEAGDFRRAIEEVRAAIAITPSRAASSRLEVIERRARLAGTLDEARRHEAAGRLERAREAYRRALGDATPAERLSVSEALHRTERKIGHATALEEAGTHVSAERWTDAERAAKRALEAKPDDPAATALLASVRRAIATAEESRRPVPEPTRPEKKPEKPSEKKPPPEPPPAREPLRMTNKVGMAFVLVPGGDFTIGDALGQPDEQPVRKVTLDAFFVGVHETTNLQYEQFDRRHKRRRSEFSPGDDHPVVNVTWSQAQKFCRWLGRLEGVTYRLPTEAEWEAAARGADARRFPWGEAAADAGGVYRANWGQGDDESAWDRDRFLYAAPVGSFPAGAGPFGCLDMAGNVWEWCLDWYGATAYAKLPTKNPRGPRRGRERVVRGGSFANDIEVARSSNRHKLKPKIVDAAVGFRVVRELHPKKDRALLEGLAE